ncbi:P-loop containing nucleoside triphosphate hydrolase protein [Conidiobolus coronatus NRRL 28638]|uniref:RNA helicase n=1 Tax=Conidiobolus coronatus (strain ATCC 28846 / CBS 209.66 / NRRL 28638) TaxID=796925 RepID=A0A137PB81_CONC2|nr:P-loop containing nucleoside triphosphate hydrolase protein [Conidiobolus coronatus NRRL 28638]|eukprot:KXN72234.1 P-loop containing nucleoside triphosphate hydrolase protein [Conidiobolus coronatus NRRL 28638]
MNELDELTKLSLISKLTEELYNHTSVHSTEMAEFVITLHSQSKNLKEFKQNLDQNGAEFEDAFISHLDRLIKNLGPNKGRKQFLEDELQEPTLNYGSVLSTREKKFPGLAIPDSKPLELETKESGSSSKGILNELEALESGISDSRSSRRRSPERSHRRNRSPSRDDHRDSRRRRRDDSRSPGPDSRRRYRSRSRSPNHRSDRMSRRREAMEEMDDKPVLYKIYDGRISNIKDFGAFVELRGIKGRCEGMVHISAIQPNVRINHPSDVVSRGQSVKVKVISIAGTRIGLSMKDVDQFSGRDLNPISAGTSANTQELGRRSKLLDLADPTTTTPGVPKKSESRWAGVKRISSPERWELKQLMAAGVLDPSQLPNFDEDHGLVEDHEVEEDLDIELKEDEPAFLKGQTRQSVQLSPIKVVKAPDGSLNRAAIAGSTYAKERKEIKQQQAQAELDAMKEDANAAWVDPMAQPGERNFVQDIKSNIAKATQVPEWKKSAFNNATTFGKITSLSIQEQRQSLPVYKLRNELIKAFDSNRVLIVVGDTGSGKTTQMAQYFYEEGYAAKGRIGCTQPRRVAAVSVAKRVSEEVGCRLGAEVGYTIRFEDCTSPETKIKFMTEGMLTRECLIDPTLSNYSVLILDEAHERTINTDVIFGLLKKAMTVREDLKLVVTSATLDAEKFSNYFFGCPIFSIPGRTYPVEILYAREPEPDYLKAALDTVMIIHLTEPTGDILLFLTGQEEIDSACETLFERMKQLGEEAPELIILPVYSSLPGEMQSKIFEPAPPGSRKVVIATNIAETSITIDGIYYVVDPGFVKQNAYDPKLGMDSLVVTPVSQAQARQRSGRAGRTGPGKCYRLYTESAYQNEMLPNSIPEIQRSNLSMVVLNLKAMGINDLINFDFMDPPPVQTLVTALEQLYSLSALDAEGLLTRLGRKMAEFPMEPPLSKMLIASVDMGCSEEILTLVAMLSVQSVFYRPREKQQQADSKKAKFHQPEGDHLTLLTVYNAWKAANYSAQWCYENFIQAKTLKRASDVRKQLLGIMDRYKQDIISCGRDYNRVRRAICSGFFTHAAKKDPQEGYKTLVEGTPVYIHPSSALFNKSPEWVIYHELVLTSKEYMRETTAIEPKWLVEVAPTFFQVADAHSISKRKKQEKIEPLYNKYEKPNEWRLSKIKTAGRASQTF